MELLLYSHPQWFEAAVPNLFGSKDQFQGQWLFHGRGWGGGEQWGTMGNSRWSFTCSLAAYLLLGSPVPNKPQTDTWLANPGRELGNDRSIQKMCLFQEISKSYPIWENRLNHVWTVNCCEHVGSIRLNWFFWVQSFYFLIILFILFFTVLGLCCCVRFSLAVVSGGYSLVAVHGLLLSVASLVLEHGF